MKKLVSLALALLLCLSTVQIALAGQAEYEQNVLGRLGLEIAGNGEVFVEGATLTPYGGNVDLTSGDVEGIFYYGDTIYISVFTDDLTPAALRSRCRFFPQWDVGKNLIQSFSLVSKKATYQTYTVSGYTGALAPVNGTYKAATKANALRNAYDLAKSLSTNFTAYDATGADHDVKAEMEYYNTNHALAPASTFGEVTDYGTFLALRIKDSYTVKPADLVGTIAYGRTRNLADEIFVAATIENEPATVWGSGTNSLYISDPSSSGVLQLGDFTDGDTDIEFGNWALYRVDTTHQSSEVNVVFDLDWDEEIDEKYSRASLDYLNFPARPTFQRNGTMYIFADPDQYLYEVKDGDLSTVSAKYDEDMMAYRFHTRTLGSYVLSDTRLGEVEKAEAEAKAKEEAEAKKNAGKKANPVGPSVKPNPGTGR